MTPAPPPTAELEHSRALTHSLGAVHPAYMDVPAIFL